MYLPKFECLHWKGGSMGIRNTTRDAIKKPLEVRLRMRKMSTDAMSMFMRKHYMDKYPKILLNTMIYATEYLGKFRVFLESIR